jgi:hypothetical protein
MSEWKRKKRREERVKKRSERRGKILEGESRSWRKKKK